jgi:hypothetical protein
MTDDTTRCVSTRQSCAPSREIFTVTPGEVPGLQGKKEGTRNLQSGTVATSLCDVLRKNPPPRYPSSVLATRPVRLGQAGFVRKQKIGKSNYYINEPLFALLTGVTLEE